MRELRISGKVRRVESGTWTDKNGVINPRGKVVLAAEFDKFEVELDRDAVQTTVVKLKGLAGREGQDVDLLVGVASGDSFRADARFIFLDDLTPTGAKG